MHVFIVWSCLRGESTRGEVRPLSHAFPPSALRTGWDEWLCREKICSMRRLWMNSGFLLKYQKSTWLIKESINIGKIGGRMINYSFCSCWSTPNRSSTSARWILALTISGVYGLPKEVLLVIVRAASSHFRRDSWAISNASLKTSASQYRA